MPTTAKWVDRAKKDDTGKTFVRCRLVARDFKHSPCSHCCRSSSSWSAFVRFVPFSAALSWYSFMRLVAACAFAVPFSSSSIRLRQLSVCACLAVPRSNDMHPGHLAVNPNSSKFSREMYTRFGTGTCYSASNFSLNSLSITMTSLLRRSPSIFGSSSFLRHGTATTLVNHTPFRFPTMTSAVVALTPK